MTRFALHIGLMVLAAANLFPLFWMLVTAFKSLPEATRAPLDLWPDVWMWPNLRQTLDAAPFGRYFLTTFITASCTAAGVAATSVAAAYAFARLRFPGRDALFVLLLITMMIPFELTLIPNFVLITQLGWYNTYAALIVPWCANAFAIFLVRQSFLGIPPEYWDAARMDGCGHLRFLWHIAVPLARPMIVTVMLFSFLANYNALLWPLVVTSDEAHRVVQVGLTAFVSDAGLRVNLLMCASLIVMLPTLLIYLVAQRYFDRFSPLAGLKG